MRKGHAFWRTRDGVLRTECWVSPQNTYTETFNPTVTVFRDGAFEKQLGLDEIMKIGTPQ